MTHFFLPVMTLWWREVIRFVRQRSRLVGAFAQPLVFWLLLGGGFSASFRPPGAPQGTGYLEYLYPGTIILVLLFTAIFATIAVIEDRKAGFLQGVLVAPVPRMSIVLGQALGGTTLAMRHCSDRDFRAVCCGRHVFGVLRAHEPGLDHRLAYGIDPGVPCHHEPDPPADLVPLRSVLSGYRSACLAHLAHAA